MGLPTAADMASWPARNVVNPETQQPLVLSVEITLTSLVLAFVGMRFYSRTVLIKALGADDWVMLAAAVITVATSISTCISTSNHLYTGYHLWDMPREVLDNPGPTGQMAMATQLLFIPITVLTKSSVLLSYLRIFPSKLNKWFCYSMLTYTILWSIGTFIPTLFQCTPIEAYWMPLQYPNAKCLNIILLYYTTGTLNVIGDFLIFLWPAKDLSTVQISLKQRAILISMFTLGVIICIAGVCRVWYTKYFVESYDVYWHGAVIYVIISIETSLGIICGCLPGCKPLLSRAFPAFFASSAMQDPTQKSVRTKATKVDGQSFPFQALSGGIERKDEFRVTTEQKGALPGIGVKRNDVDGMSVDSDEWIVMQELTKDVEAQTTRRGV